MACNNTESFFFFFFEKKKIVFSNMSIEMLVMVSTSKEKRVHIGGGFLIVRSWDAWLEAFRSEIYIKCVVYSVCFHIFVFVLCGSWFLFYKTFRYETLFILLRLVFLSIIFMCIWSENKNACSVLVWFSICCWFV